MLAAAALAASGACSSRDGTPPGEPSPTRPTGDAARNDVPAANAAPSNAASASAAAANAPAANAAAANAAAANARPANPASAAWPELADLTIADPIRVIALPSRPDRPRFDVGGPAIVGDVAVVSSSQFGFAAVDWRRGQLVWTKPAGLHVAPPIAWGDAALLIGECLAPPEVPDRLLGCARVVGANGADQSYAAIHGAHVEAFAQAAGPQQVWLDGPRTARWRRGEVAVAIDLVTGVASPASPEPPAVHVVDGKRAWDITQNTSHLIAREHGKLSWQTARPYTDLIGAVYLADSAPMIRVTRVGAFGGVAELNLLDIDATGSLHGQAAHPVPAIATLGHAIDAVGNTAIAVRLDSSLHRDFIAGYAANALLMYVYPLPEVPRVDPVGVAIASDGVLVFHDGDTFTVLPELSTPPTAPGAPKPLSRNPTP